MQPRKEGNGSTMNAICETVTKGWQNNMNTISPIVMKYWLKCMKREVQKCWRSLRRSSFSLILKGEGHIIVNGTDEIEASNTMKRRIRTHRRPRLMTLDLFRRSAEWQKAIPRPTVRYTVTEQALPFEDMDFTVKKKRCPYCGKILPFNLFNLSRHAKDGRQPYCRACQKRYKDEHPDIEYKYKHNNIGTLQIRW